MRPMEYQSSANCLERLQNHLLAVWQPDSFPVYAATQWMEIAEIPPQAENTKDCPFDRFASSDADK